MPQKNVEYHLQSMYRNGPIFHWADWKVFDTLEQAKRHALSVNLNTRILTVIDRLEIANDSETIID